MTTPQAISSTTIMVVAGYMKPMYDQIIATSGYVEWKDYIIFLLLLVIIYIKVRYIN